MTAIAAPHRSTLSTVRHQIRYDLLAQSRNREARFFTLAMPIGFLLLFGAIFGNAWLVIEGNRVRESTYYVANLTTFGIVDVGLMTLLVDLVGRRESGVLRRRFATPLEPSVIVMARAVGAVAAAGVLATFLLLVGRLVYGAGLPWNSLPALAVSVLVGCLAFVSLGFALTTVVRSAESAQPVAMSVGMTLLFLSGVFIPWNMLPSGLHVIADAFPVRHEAVAVLGPFAGHPWHPLDLLVVVGWGMAGFAVAVRRFGWSPRDV